MKLHHYYITHRMNKPYHTLLRCHTRETEHIWHTYICTNPDDPTDQQDVTYRLSLPYPLYWTYHIFGEGESNVYKNQLTSSTHKHTNNTGYSP